MNESSRLLKALREHGYTVADTYPYTFVVGQWLRSARLEWWSEFTVAEPESARLPLQQAQDYAFAAYCEQTHESEFLQAAAGFISAADEHLLVELRNTVTWYTDQAESSGAISEDP